MFIAGSELLSCVKLSVKNAWNCFTAHVFICMSVCSQGMYMFVSMWVRYILILARYLQGTRNALMHRTTIARLRLPSQLVLLPSWWPKCTVSWGLWPLKGIPMYTPNIKGFLYRGQITSINIYQPSIRTWPLRADISWIWSSWMKRIDGTSSSKRRSCWCFQIRNTTTSWLHMSIWDSIMFFDIALSSSMTL